MDVRKWLTDKLTEMRFLGEYGSTESLPADYVEKITRELEPAITKLAEAFLASARNHHKLMGYVSRRDAYPRKSTEECATKQFEDCMNCDCVDAKAALAELEKP